MTHRRNFRDVGVGARGKRSHLITGDGTRLEVVSAHRDEHGVVVEDDSGVGRRLGAGDTLHVVDTKTKKRRRFNHRGQETT